MCGIIGYVGKKDCLKVLINGLEKLEYRGYDSAGVAYIKNKKIEIIKEEGKIVNLKKKINFKIDSNLGIGHTRWATHGKPNYVNSHPHRVGKITIVHNGIIENYLELKKELIKNGYSFKSDTDTEVACALLDYIYKETHSIEQTLAIFKDKAEGAYAIGLICDDNLDYLYAVKKDSPLIIALGKEENYIASDVPAILEYTNKYITLEDGEFAKISNDKVIVFDKDAEIVKKEIKVYDGKSGDLNKNGFEHYMLKEIYEEVEVVKQVTNDYIKDGIKSLTSNMPKLGNYERIDIVACGSAYHAGLVGKSLIEGYANIPVNVELASEYRYKKLFLNKNVLVILISQSGETADTLAALKIAKEKGAHTLGIINVVGSSIARYSDDVLYTKAGAEIAVATTKAYTAQITMLSLLALNLAYKNKEMTEAEVLEALDEAKKLPTNIQSVLNEADFYKTIARKIFKHNDVFFIGRLTDYALALEGSLKLKEIAYVNSQGYAAGELKHGTISLIEKNTPVFGIVTDTNIASKTLSNMKECKSRGANIIALVSNDLKLDKEIYDTLIEVPKVSPIFQGVLTVIPLQLISYEVAKLRKCNIDKPKNLAKSVTVE